MLKLAVTVLICCAALPAQAANVVDTHIQILKQDQSGFDSVNSFTFGTIVSPVSVAPSSATATASAANGGTLSASYTGHSFGLVSSTLRYDLVVVGPDGAPVPVLIDTHAAVTATGDMASFAELLIGGTFATGPFSETRDYPLILRASQCSGAEAPCVNDAGQAGWSLTGATIYLLPNRIYPVNLLLTIQQRDYNISGILGNGTGTAFIDPVFTLAPSVTGYSLNNSLTTVPEPQSWALLIVGFGLTGTALRRRWVAAAA